MSCFTIMTDSCCDLPLHLVQSLGLTVLPLSFTMGDMTYLNDSANLEMPLVDFYARLRNGDMASTAAVNVGQYQEGMEEILQRGQDILVLSFSSALSTSYQSAVIAAQDLQDSYPDRKILVMDTLGASMGQGLLVYLAAKMQKNGASLEEIAHWVEENRLRISHQFTVDDLGFLKRGGRISAATAVVGTMLSVKPLLHVDGEGKLVNYGKSRGRHAALNALVSKLEHTAAPDMNTIFISHGDCGDEIAPLVAEIGEKFPQAEIVVSPIGPVIGAHAGPGTVAVFYLGSQR